MNSRQPVIGSFASLLDIEPNKAALPRSVSAIDLLMIMAKINQNQDGVQVGDLLEKSGLRIAQLGELLSSLTQAHFVNMSGEWGRELVTITDLGKTVVQAAKSAEVA